MKLKKLISIASVVCISFSTACTKKSVTATPFPSVNNTTSTLEDTQNYLPYQDPNQSNDSYYGNNSQLTDDTSGFSQGNTSANSNINIPQQNMDMNDSDIGNIPDLQPYNPNVSNNNPGANYTLVNNFAVDQDKYISASVPVIGAYANAFLPDRNQWQAVGVAVSGSDLFISALDKSGLMKKGTIIKMNASSGQNWKNLGSAWLGTRHPMDATVKGVAVDTSGNIYAGDSTTLLYGLKAPGYSVTKINSGFPSNDIAFFNGNVIISTSSGLKKTDSTLSSPSDFVPGITSSSAIGTDNSGNLYVVSGNEIKKVTSSGAVSTVVKGVSGAIDVTGIGTDIFVLTSEGINMYNKSGKLLGNFGYGDFVGAQSIASDSKNIYVVDSGSSSKDSMVLVYSNMAL